MSAHSDEVQAPREDEASAPAGDEILVADPGAEDVEVTAEASVPAADEPRPPGYDAVRFIVGDDASGAAEDELDVAGLAEDEASVPLEEAALAPPGDEVPGPEENEREIVIEAEAPVVVPDEATLPVSEAVKEEQTLGRRKHARFEVKGGAKGRVAVVWDAVLLNVSVGGALIEHANVVRPGTPSSLELELQGKRIRLRCRVARSVADRIVVQPDGERELIYHTGLQFVEPTDETLQIIGDYIHSMDRGG